MIEQKEIFDYIIEPLSLDNPVASLERLISCHISQEAKKRIASNILMKLPFIDMTDEEIKEINRIITEEKNIFRKKKDLLVGPSQIKVDGKTEKISHGETNGLFVVHSDISPFGCINRIIATSINDGKGEHKVIAAEMGNEISLSVYTAYEAVRYLLGSYDLKPGGFKTLDNYGITVQVGRAGRQYKGYSLGLSVATAILSSLIPFPVEPDVAFTGAISIRGDIEEVSGIPEKLKICRLKGMKRVYIPEKNAKDGCRIPGMAVIPSSTLKAVAEEVFGSETIASFVKRLNTQKKREDTAISAYEAKGKILISLVGNRDPYGTSYHNTDIKEYSEGPVITAFRRLNPDFVLLLPTRETMKNASKTEVEIENIVKKKICTVRLLDIPDPTDYDVVYIAILSAINSVENKLKDMEVFLSLSSGTPQMHTVLIDLIRSRRLKAHPLQVIEPRFAKSWEDRVRIVRSEYLGI